MAVGLSMLLEAPCLRHPSQSILFISNTIYLKVSDRLAVTVECEITYVRELKTGIQRA